VKKRLVSGIVVAFVVFLGVVVAGPFYVIDEGEQAVVVQLGPVVDATRVPSGRTPFARDAGLYMKVPFIDQVVRYPKRIMTWDGEARHMPTREMQFIFVDVTARWRISDPRMFYVALNTIDAGHFKLSEIIDSAVRTVVAENFLREMVRNSNHIIERGAPIAEEITDMVDEAAIITEEVQLQQEEQLPILRGRRQLAEEVLARARPIAVNQYGIEIIDVVTRQVRYTDELTQSVYARMIRERGQLAQRYRSEGEGRMAYWLGRTEQESSLILSQAYWEAEKIRGEADAYAARIFAEAYNRNQSFFDFWRAIESYRNTLPSFNSMLSTDMDYFKFLFSPN